MSFQGDVRGIGLAELLQGLARGRKEGVLTLTPHTGTRCLVGIDCGAAFFLPDPDEDPEEWHTRARDAWVGREIVDTSHLSMIARAHRLENFYEVLDGDGAHFRFDPEPLPGKNGDSEQVYCEGIPIEFLLLEYARIGDELDSIGDVEFLDEKVVPAILDEEGEQDAPLLYAQVDGMSTLRELGDRLGWPQRQVRLGIMSQLQSGRMCLEHPDNVLELALIELEANRFSRAADRLSSWCLHDVGCSMPLGAAQRLVAEWSTRLPFTLPEMSSRDVRRLLRRLQQHTPDEETVVSMWREAEQLFPCDLISRLHRCAFESKAFDDSSRPETQDVLDLAHSIREDGKEMRAAPVLAMLLSRTITNHAVQLELGQSLVESGIVDEGGLLILEAATHYVEHDSPDRALPALRLLLAADPTVREARRLFQAARRSSKHVKKLRKHLLISLAVVASIGGAAFVQVQKEKTREDRIAEITASINQPMRALMLLNTSFPGDSSPEIQALREQVHDHQRHEEVAARRTWLDQYGAALRESLKGDPVLGLTMTLALPNPPPQRIIQEALPHPKDLFEKVYASVEERLENLGNPKEFLPQQLQGEDEIERQVTQLIALLEELPEQTIHTAELAVRLSLIQDKVVSRRGRRDGLKGDREARERLDHQDGLLIQARHHAKGGDFVRAERFYSDLINTDLDGRIAEVVEEERQENAERLQAVKRAQQLAGEGQHEEAYSILATKLGVKYSFEAVMVPWEVKTYPAGATVTLGDGTERTSPFTIHSPIGDPAELEFELPGFDSRQISLERPQDLMIDLSRTPERTWRGEGRIDAVPVRAGGDTILVDRRGNLVRISGKTGEVVWSRVISSLSGIARAPVFMPGRPGHCLVVTEDGQVWVVEAQTGDLDGPWELGSPPVAGPYATQSVVGARLGDGTQVYWKDRLKPHTSSSATGAISESEESEYMFGAHGGLQVLRRRSTEKRTLVSRWTRWVVKVNLESLYVHPEGKPEAGYAVLRVGEWEYVAWEAASEDFPAGRLWVSDEAGVRAFVAP